MIIAGNIFSWIFECDKIPIKRSKESYLQALLNETISFLFLNREVYLQIFEDDMNPVLIYKRYRLKRSYKLAVTSFLMISFTNNFYLYFRCDSLQEQVSSFLNIKSHFTFEVSFDHEGCKVETVVFNKAFKKLESRIFTCNYFNPHFTNELVVKLLGSGCKYADEIGFICLMSDDNFFINEKCVDKITSLIMKRLNRIEKEYKETLRMSDEDILVNICSVIEPLEKEPPKETTKTHNLRVRRNRPCYSDIPTFCDLTVEDKSIHEDEITSVIYYNITCSDYSGSSSQQEDSFEKKRLDKETLNLKLCNVPYDPNQQKHSFTFVEDKSFSKEQDEQFIKNKKRDEFPWPQNYDQEKDRVKRDKSPRPQVNSPDGSFALSFCDTTVEEQREALLKIEQQKIRNTKIEDEVVSRFQRQPPCLTAPSLLRGLDKGKNVVIDTSVPKRPRLLDDPEYDQYKNKRKNLTFSQPSLPPFFKKLSTSAYKIPKTNEANPKSEATYSQLTNSVLARKPIHYDPPFNENPLLEKMKMPTDRTGMSPQCPNRKTPESLSTFIDSSGSVVINLADDETTNENKDVNNNGKRKLYTVPETSTENRIFKTKQRKPR